jgi:hypothetical protein
VWKVDSLSGSIEKFMMQHWVRGVLVQQEQIRGVQDVYNFSLTRPGERSTHCVQCSAAGVRMRPIAPGCCRQ